MRLASGSFSLVVGIALSSSCHKSREREPDHPSPAPGDVVPGYRHDLSHSLFKMGRILGEVQDPIFFRTVGSEGVYATNRRNGMSVGILNGNSKLAAAPSFGRDASEQADRVRRYFVSSGLPEAQVGVTEPEARVDEVGPVGGRDPERKYSYRAKVNRQIGGINVRDSFAWAAISESQTVTAEQVFWPELPTAVINEAIRFKGVLESSQGLAAYRDKLPAEVRDRAGAVVIRHLSWTANSASPGAAVYFDIVSGETVRHFGTDGKEQLLGVPTNIRPSDEKHKPNMRPTSGHRG